MKGRKGRREGKDKKKTEGKKTEGTERQQEQRRMGLRNGGRRDKERVPRAHNEQKKHRNIYCYLPCAYSCSFALFEGCIAAKDEKKLQLHHQCYLK